MLQSLKSFALSKEEQKSITGGFERYCCAVYSAYYPNNLIMTNWGNCPNMDAGERKKKAGDLIQHQYRC